MPGKSTLTIRVNVEGLDSVLRAFRDLPKEATDELRTAAQELSKDMANWAAQAGRSEGHQAALVATTVRAQRDRVPVVVAGGSKRLGRNKKPAFKLLFGSEFGSSLPQYKPHIGNDSYWFFKSIEKNQQEIYKEWLAAADKIINDFNNS